MSDVSVRGSVTYVHKLWDAVLGQPRSRNRNARPSRSYRIPVCSNATPLADHAGTQRNGRAAMQHMARSAPISPSSPDLGYSREFSKRFDVGEKIGSGGNATVYVVSDKMTRKVFACKSIKKAVEGPNVSESKHSGHISSIRREIQVLKKLRGSLNVACLEEVYEDATSVHLVLDYCKGGELVHAIGSRHYSERTVSAQAGVLQRTVLLGKLCLAA